jgi:hypothetical protein
VTAEPRLLAPKADPNNSLELTGRAIRALRGVLRKQARPAAQLGRSAVEEVPVDNYPPTGSIGRALGTLAPSGPVEILGPTFSARTISESIETGQFIFVTGFDHSGLLVREATPAEMTPASLSPSPPRQASTAGVGNYFLMVGAVLALLGCIFTVFSTLYGLWTMTQVSPLITLSTADSTLLHLSILLDGVVKFHLSAALFVVFVRLYRLT